MMSDGLPCDYRHAVEAELPSGPAFQPFHCPVAAGALFDRLRDLFPTVPLRRYARGQVVEIHKPTGDMRPTVDPAPA